MGWKFGCISEEKGKNRKGKEDVQLASSCAIQKVEYLIGSPRIYPCLIMLGIGNLWIYTQMMMNSFH
jgi:hypothetical protein